MCSGWGEGDLQAEGFELSDVVADLPLDVDARGVVVGAEVVVGGVGVGEQVPDDDEDGAGDGDEGFAFASAFDDAAVAFAEECGGAGGCGGGVAEYALEVGVAAGGFAAASFGSGLGESWAGVGPGEPVLQGGEAGPVGADVGEGEVSRVGADVEHVGQW